MDVELLEKARSLAKQAQEEKSASLAKRYLKEAASVYSAAIEDTVDPQSRLSLDLLKSDCLSRASLLEKRPSKSKVVETRPFEDVEAIIKLNRLMSGGKASSSSVASGMEHLLKLEEALPRQDEPAHAMMLGESFIVVPGSQTGRSMKRGLNLDDADVRNLLQENQMLKQQATLLRQKTAHWRTFRSEYKKRFHYLQAEMLRWRDSTSSAAVEDSELPAVLEALRSQHIRLEARYEEKCRECEKKDAIIMRYEAYYKQLQKSALAKAKERQKRGTLRTKNSSASSLERAALLASARRAQAKPDVP